MTYAISVEPFGTAKAVTKCMTHDWMMEYPAVSADTLCPIGRVEHATDRALEMIRAEREKV